MSKTINNAVLLRRKNKMLKNLKAEQARARLTNKQVADYLGISANAYMFKN